MPGSKLTNEDLKERLRLYSSEFAEMCRLGYPREQLLNGHGSRHGFNHIGELIQMLPVGNGGEFKVRE